jgi:hypothetical protein
MRYLISTLKPARGAVAVLLACAAPVGTASAAVIPGLFNTGTDANGVALVGGNGVVDPNYRIFSSTSPGLAGNQAVTFNFPYPIPEDANSRWISVSANGNPGSNTTAYRLSFDLSGFDPSTALINGSFAADNAASITLNGVATGISTTFGFTQFTNFSLNSGFVAGINTLDFVVVDASAPTALRVDNLAGTAELRVGGAVPEPATWAMMICGFGAVGASLRRRTQVRVAFA